jgi:hypothetical protein
VTAEEFVSNGAKAKVILADVQDDLGWDLTTELGPESPFYTHCDVIEEAQVATAVDLTVSCQHRHRQRPHARSSRVAESR